MEPLQQREARNCNFLFEMSETRWRLLMLVLPGVDHPLALAAFQRRVQDGEFGKIVAQIPPVSGDETIGVRLGMRADQKIGHDAPALAPAL